MSSFVGWTQSVVSVPVLYSKKQTRKINMRENKNTEFLNRTSTLFLSRPTPPETQHNERATLAVNTLQQQSSTTCLPRQLFQTKK